MGSELERKLQQPISDEHARAILRQASERALEHGEDQLTGHHVRQAAIEALIPEADIDAVLNGYYFGEKPAPSPGSLREVIHAKAAHMECSLIELLHNVPDGYGSTRHLYRPGTFGTNSGGHLIEHRVCFDLQATTNTLNLKLNWQKVIHKQLVDKEYPICTIEVLPQNTPRPTQLSFMQRVLAAKDLLLRGQQDYAPLLAPTSTDFQVIVNSRLDEGSLKCDLPFFITRTLDYSTVPWNHTAQLALYSITHFTEGLKPACDEAIRAISP